MNGASPGSGLRVPARPRPAAQEGAWQRLRRGLFPGGFASLATLMVLALALWTLPQWGAWAVVHAVWGADAEACQAARGQGACWGVIVEKHRLILLGRYPYEAQWRPVLASVVLAGLIACSGWPRCWRPWLGAAWALGLAAVWALMGGGVLGLSEVPTDRWGGLPLTLMLATVSIATAFPLGVAAALGRRSRLPAVRAVCTLYIELVRGVPLVSILFMASFLFPLLLPPGRTPDVLLRVWVGLSLFAGAYLAEIVRAGLQAVPAGQLEAAASIGLGRWATLRLVVLPQALASVVPSLMNSFIGLFKDTSLITIVSLYELTGSLGLALNGDPEWRPYKVEGYLFISVIYFAICFALSQYSRRLESHLARQQARE